jgi:hypothetical protein
VRFIEPFAALDEFRAKITEMRDRAAKAGQPEPRENTQDFERRTGMNRCLNGFIYCAHQPLRPS